MPTYALLNVNMTLLFTATLINCTFFTRSVGQMISLIMIIGIWIILFESYSSRKFDEHAIFDELNMQEKIKFIIPDSLSVLYIAHMFMMLLIFFILISLAALNLKLADTAIEKLNKLRADRFCELMAFETNPYIVFSTKTDKPEASYSM